MSNFTAWVYATQYYISMFFLPMSSGPIDPELVNPVLSGKKMAEKCYG